MLNRVMVVDDEAHAREDLSDLLGASGRVDQIDVVADANDALLQLRERAYDALFLDIRMPGLDGLQLAAILQRFAEPPSIVFVSAYEEHAVEAFSLEATDYLLKPVSSDRLDRTLVRLEAARAKEPPPPEASGDTEDDHLPFVGVEVADRTVLIERVEIRYVEAEGDYVRLHTADDSYLVRRSMSSLAEAWERFGFVRIHRSYVVNLRHVAQIEPYFNQTLVIRVKDRTGTRLPVSRRRARELRDRLELGSSGR
jgi:DNA-binding LytR/AlgR family response regulator